MCRNCQVASVQPWSRQVARSAWTGVRRRRGGTTWTGRGERRESAPSAGSRVWRYWRAGALCAGTWRRQAHDEPAPPDERGGVTAGHRPRPRGRRSPAARFREVLSTIACAQTIIEFRLYPNPHSGLDFTGRAEPTAAELAPTAQQRDGGGSGRYWGSSPGERAHDETNRADDTGCGESVSLSAASGQLQFPARRTPLATGPPQTDDRPRRGTWTGCRMPRPRRPTRPTAWNPTRLAASAAAPTFCATSKRSSIEMAATRRPTSFTTGTRLT